MKRFMPHEFKPQMALIRPMAVNVLITQDAYDKMFYLVKHNKEEVGWLCTVQRDGYSFLLSDVIVYEQEVNGATTEISVEGLTKVTMELLSKPNGVELVNSLRCWGHSHPSFSTSPSGQDDKQLMEFEKNDADYFIRVIANKLGSFSVTVALFRENMIIVDVPWEIHVPARVTTIEAEMKAEIAAKVREKKYSSFPSHGYEQGQFMHDWENSREWDPHSRSYKERESKDHFRSERWTPPSARYANERPQGGAMTEAFPKIALVDDDKNAATRALTTRGAEIDRRWEGKDSFPVAPKFKRSKTKEPQKEHKLDKPAVTFPSVAMEHTLAGGE